MPAETLIFQDENITITTQRVLANGRTYATSHISSVAAQDLGRGGRVTVGRILIFLGVANIALGTCIILAFFTPEPRSLSSTINVLLGVLLVNSILLIPGILILRSARRKYAVTIVTSGSVIDLSGGYAPLSIRVLESEDRNYIQTVNDHVSKAIALRG
jgi:hypothetical protein